MKSLFNAVTADEVMTINLKNGKVYLNKQEISKERVKTYQAEANILQESLLFQQLLKDMKYAANFQMYENSSKDDDIVFGKAVLWAVDVIEKKIKGLIKIK